MQTLNKRALRRFVGATTLLLASLAALVVVPGIARARLNSPWSRHAGERGALIAYHRIAHLSRSAIVSELGQARIGPGDPALGAGAVRHGIVAYRVVYMTRSALGQMLRASGLVAFPRGVRAALPLVEYGHGTTATRSDVPSSFGLDGGNGIEGRWTAELFASAGFAIALPDYVGMGVGRTRPEYEIARSEATASLDLLRATETIARRTGRRLDRRVLVTGFSQGGAAAEALAQALANSPSPRLTLGAVAAISGPYELTAAELPGMFDGRVSPSIASYYLGYVLTAWNPIYHLFGRPSDAFRPPYAGRVEGLFDGSHQDGQIATRLPGDFHQLITARFLAQLRHPSGRLRRALEINSPCPEWHPRVPVRLYAASGDDTVTQANAEICAHDIRSHGGHVRVIQLGAVNHDVSDFLALPRVLRWFARLTQRRI